MTERLLNCFFTRPNLSHMVNDPNISEYLSFLKEYLRLPGGNSHLEIIADIYQYLAQKHRNEYFYKNSLLHHTMYDEHGNMPNTAISELPIGKSKADLIVIDDKATVYEIKTELDTLGRLERQVANYYKVFTRVVVVTSDSHYEKVATMLVDTPVGIHVLNQDGSMDKRKEPVEDASRLSSTAMFKVLRKREQETIIRQLKKELPVTNDFERYRRYQSIFETLPLDILEQVFVDALARRNRVNADALKDVPYELRYLVYFSDYKPKDYVALQTFLEDGI